MSDHSPTSTPPSDATLWFNVGGYLLLILLFVLIAAIAYLPNRPPPLDADRAAYRLAERQKVEAASADANRYGWINKDEGVVRLPINRAMELTVRELSTKGTAPAAP